MRSRVPIRTSFIKPFCLSQLGQYFRTFVEPVNRATARPKKTKSTFEQDSLDVLHAFADMVVPARKSADFTLRAGRQDMILGSSRLVSLREAPNVRRAFNGARAFWKALKKKRVDAFLVRPVTPQFGVFDGQVAVVHFADQRAPLHAEM